MTRISVSFEGHMLGGKKADIAFVLYLFPKFQLFSNIQLFSKPWIFALGAPLSLEEKGSVPIQRGGELADVNASAGGKDWAGTKDDETYKSKEQGQKASLGPLFLLLRMMTLVENNELIPLKLLKSLGSQSSADALWQTSKWEPLPDCAKWVSVTLDCVHFFLSKGY